MEKFQKVKQNKENELKRVEGELEKKKKEVHVFIFKPFFRFRLSELQEYSFSFEPLSKLLKPVLFPSAV